MHIAFFSSEEGRSFEGGIHLGRSAVSYNFGISVGNGVLKANDTNSLCEFGGPINLTDDCARSILQSME